MTIGKTCRSCFGGGVTLTYTAFGEPPEEMTCDACQGKGFIFCERCMDTGWEPMADLYGDYDSDEPCTCVIGRQVMHQEAMPGDYTGSLF